MLLQCKHLQVLLQCMQLQVQFLLLYADAGAAKVHTDAGANAGVCIIAYEGSLKDIRGCRCFCSVSNCIRCYVVCR